MSYKKDKEGWHVFSKSIEDVKDIPFYKEREVWWVSIGVNIGHEEDGKGSQYSRPVLVLKKFGKHTFLGIPLSTTSKASKLIKRFSFVDGISSAALLGQIRSFDSRRLLEKYGTISEDDFAIIRKAAKDLL